jgi:hypothetical protein
MSERTVDTLDTLVHLYDSLNGQIEAAKSDLNDFMQIGFSPTTKNEVIDLLCAKKEKRLEKLYSMRDDVEELLARLLNTGVNE